MKLLKALYSLISARSGGLSVGRVAFWVTFGFLCYYWFKQYNVPESLVDICQTTLGYELFKKARDVWDAKKTVSEIDPTKVG